MEVTAYHEAGHAFMAVYLGAEVPSVTIEPDRDDGPRRSGDTAVAWRPGRSSEREFRERAVQVSLAGPVAEMLYTGERFHPAAVIEWSADWSEAWQQAARLFPIEEKRLVYLEQTAVRLHRLLDSEPHWSALAEIADQLLAHETLEAEQVREIVEQWLG